ncbi:MAG: hypothetical protein U0172_02945 [Nitrospiraceae bacterium]
MSNSDQAVLCSCGYDLTQRFGRQRGAMKPPVAAAPTVVYEMPEMSRGYFVIGIAAVWALLVVGEWWRVQRMVGSSRLDLGGIQEGLAWASASLLGAIAVGTVAWVSVWIIRSYEGLTHRLCPKRTTLLVTSVAAAGLYLIRFLTPTTVLGYAVPIVLLLIVAIFSYVAGSRQWIGRW